MRIMAGLRYTQVDRLLKGRLSILRNPGVVKVSIPRVREGCGNCGTSDARGLAEANGNRTHLSQQSCDTQVLKTRRVTRPYAPPAADYNTSRPPTGVAKAPKTRLASQMGIANLAVAKEMLSRLYAARRPSVRS
jgi:hypothetical protein